MEIPFAQDFVVECTIANNAIGSLPEYDVNAKLFGDVPIEERVDYQIIRLANSIFSKQQKYNDKYSKESWVGEKPYIIAVAPFEQPNSFEIGNDGIIPVLYGERLNHSVMKYDIVNEIKKQNGSDIPLGLFKKPEYKNVSAIMYSNVATIGKVDAMGNNPYCTFLQLRRDLNASEPIFQLDSRLDFIGIQTGLNNSKSSNQIAFYRETITDGLTLYLNPLAENQLSNRTLQEMFVAGVDILRFDLENNTFDESLFHDHFLLHRIVHKIKLV